MKTPIKLQFVYSDKHGCLCGWVCKWNNQTLCLCRHQVSYYIPNNKPFTLILRKTPAEGFTPIKLWFEGNDRWGCWKHDQSLPYGVFLGGGIDNFLTNLAEGKIKMTLYFKFSQ
jgi:hypothetical protein